MSFIAPFLFLALGSSPSAGEASIFYATQSGVLLLDCMIRDRIRLYTSVWVQGRILPATRCPLRLLSIMDLRLLLGFVWFIVYTPNCQFIPDFVTLLLLMLFPSCFLWHH